MAHPILGQVSLGVEIFFRVRDLGYLYKCLVVFALGVFCSRGILVYVFVSWGGYLVFVSIIFRVRDLGYYQIYCFILFWVMCYEIF